VVLSEWDRGGTAPSVAQQQIRRLTADLRPAGLRLVVFRSDFPSKIDLGCLCDEMSGLVSSDHRHKMIYDVFKVLSETKTLGSVVDVLIKIFLSGHCTPPLADTTQQA
jgi:hypothetical protein